MTISQSLLLWSDEGLQEASEPFVPKLCPTPAHS
jgi:hypothetical protein